MPRFTEITSLRGWRPPGSVIQMTSSSEIPSPQAEAVNNRAVNSAYARQWAWDKINLRQAWKSIGEEACKQASIVVAIADWGIQADHEAFPRGLVMDGLNVLPRSRRNLSDDDGHGTMLAGTIAGVLSNISGGGQANRSVQILPIKFIDAHNPPMAENAAIAITRAADAGAKIINASWDIGLDSRDLREALAYAKTRNILVVVAAGNSGGNNTDYPTVPASLQFGSVTWQDSIVRLDNIITVMATTPKIINRDSPITAIMSTSRLPEWIFSARPLTMPDCPPTWRVW